MSHVADTERVIACGVPEMRVDCVCEGFCVREVGGGGGGVVQVGRDEGGAEKALYESRGGYGAVGGADEAPDGAEAVVGIDATGQIGDLQFQALPDAACEFDVACGLVVLSEGVETAWFGKVISITRLDP